MSDGRPEQPDDSEPTPERQAELRKVYEVNVAVGKPPYAGVVIGSRGELDWIIRVRGWKAVEEAQSRSDLPDLREAGITGDMRQIDLTRGNLREAYVVRANFAGAQLHAANLRGAYVEDTNFTGADLSTADLSSAGFAHTDWSGANLQAANLSGALMTGDFSGANFTRARMDAATIFAGGTERLRMRVDTRIRLLDVSWNGAILARVNWDDVPRLGDEADIQAASSRTERVQAYRDTARAYHGLAKALEAQGLYAPALRYRRRQHQLERAALLRNFKLGPWFFSSLLNVVSGYGDRPGRALRAYLAVILVFAAVYFGITNFAIFTSGSHPLQWYEAVVLSLTSFHGRGFFPQFTLGDPIAVVAALEAIVGLFIELVLIATFTQRFFAR